MAVKVCIPFLVVKAMWSDCESSSTPALADSRVIVLVCSSVLSWVHLLGSISHRCCCYRLLVRSSPSGVYSLLTAVFMYFVYVFCIVCVGVCVCVCVCVWFRELGKVPSACRLLSSI